VICEGGKRRESTSCFKELLSSRKIQDVEDIQGYLTQKNILEIGSQCVGNALLQL
jgi:hypothetical protein